MLSELSEGEGPCSGPGGGLTSALRRRGGRSGGTPAPFAALQYPLLQTSKDDMQTRAEATLNLLNNLLGAGLLSMPYAMASAGLLTGLALMAVVAVANRYTLLLVLKMSEAVLEENSYPEIGRHVFGQHGLLAVLAAYLLFTGGILTAYLIAITDILQQLTWLSGAPRLVLVFLAVLICAPGATLRSLRHVALLSGVCMLGVCALVVTLTAVCIGDLFSPAQSNAPIDYEGRPGDVDLFRFDPRRLLAGCALFALQFSVQAGGIEVLSRIRPDERSDPAGAEADVGGGGDDTSSVPAAEGISKVAFSIAGAFSAVIGSAAYLRFGDKVKGDVLLNFGPTAPQNALTVARVAYGFVVTCSFAFIMVPCRFAALDVFALRRRDHVGETGDAVPAEKFRRVTAAILAACSAVAWLVPDLARMLELVGVWATMALAFVLPCAFFLELRRRQEGLAVLSPANALPLGLVAFGILVAVVSGVDGILGVARGSAPGGASGHRAVVHDLTSVRSSAPSR